MLPRWTILAAIITFVGMRLAEAAKPALVLDPQDVEIVAGKSANVTAKLLNGGKGMYGVAKVKWKHADIVQVTPTSLKINTSIMSSWTLHLKGVARGHDTILLSLNNPDEVNEEGAFVRVTVSTSYAMTLTSVIIGWLYFVAWSVSFYPQVVENYKRKSVVGLNFDFLTFNIIGFTLYSVFNCGLYWSPTIEAEYFSRHPRGLNPVQLNDIVFAVHGAIVTLFTIGQCLVYERGGQSVSKLALLIVVVFIIVVIVMAALAGAGTTHWLDFLYACSYIKLTITLIKYIPQAVMNYRRKSTKGWSIGNILLDFTGGVLSVLQMIINAYNYNDWESIFGDITKFGLGLFSVLFDIFFLIQHYGLYRNVTGKEYSLSFQT